MSLLIEALKRAELQRKQQPKAAAIELQPPSPPENLPATPATSPASDPASNPSENLTEKPLDFPLEKAPEEKPAFDFSLIALEEPAAPPAAEIPEARFEPTLLTEPSKVSVNALDALTLAEPVSPGVVAPPKEKPATTPAVESSEPKTPQALTLTPQPPGESKISAATPMEAIPPSVHKPQANIAPPEKAETPPAPQASEKKAPPPSKDKLKAQALKTMLVGQTPAAPGKRRLLLIILFGLSALTGMAGYLWWLSESTVQGSMMATQPPQPPFFHETTATPAESTDNPTEPLAAETTEPFPPTRQATVQPTSPQKPEEGSTASQKSKPPRIAAEQARTALPLPPVEARAKPASTSSPTAPPTQKTTSRRNDPADEAWQALRAGRTEDARASYQAALKNDPRNREVLLGLAEAAVRDGRVAQAVEYYERVLRLNPRDPDANAGMALLHGHSDPLTYESRLQALLGEQASSPGLHFALGTLQAGQKRWHEAQQSFFQACTLAPDNADYHFNLAVSLDQMGKYRNARDFYEKALLLAQKRQGSFSRDAAQSRLETLTEFIQ